MENLQKTEKKMLLTCLYIKNEKAMNSVLETLNFFPRSFTLSHPLDFQQS